MIDLHMQPPKGCRRTLLSGYPTYKYSTHTVQPQEHSTYHLLQPLGQRGDVHQLLPDLRIECVYVHVYILR